MEKYLRVNLLGPGPRLMKKIIYRAAVWQRLRHTDLDTKTDHSHILQLSSHPTVSTYGTYL